MELEATRSYGGARSEQRSRAAAGTRGPAREKRRPRSGWSRLLIAACCLMAMAQQAVVCPPAASFVIETLRDEDAC